jgi:hypothetical protein
MLWTAGTEILLACAARTKAAIAPLAERSGAKRDGDAGGDAR